MTTSAFEPPSHPLPYTPLSYWHDMRTSIDEAIARGQVGPSDSGDEGDET